MGEHLRRWVQVPGQRLRNGRTRRRLVGAILLVGVLSRVAFIVYVDAVDADRAVNPDSASYIESGRALAEEGRFSRTASDPTPMFVRTPGYPAYLALVRTVAGDSLVWPLIGQTLIAAAGALLLYLIARRLFGAAVAVVALLLVTLDPLQTAFAGTMLTETLFTTLFIAALYCLVRFLQEPGVSLPWAAASGLALAMATLTRPTTYYLPVVVLIFLVVKAVATGTNVRRAVTAAVGFLVPIALLLGGWQLRNADQVGSGRLSGVEAVNLYWYVAAGTLAEDTGGSIDEARDQLSTELYDSLSIDVGNPRPYRRGTLPSELYERQGEVYGRAYERGMDIITDRPVALARVWVRNLVRVLMAPGKTEVLGYFAGHGGVPVVATGLALVAIALTWILAVLGFTWAFLRRPEHRLVHVALASVVAYILVVSAGPWAEARMRAPVMPVVLMYAAVAIVHIARAVGVGSPMPTA